MCDLLLRDALRHRAVWFGAAMVAASVAFFITLCLDFILAVRAAPEAVLAAAADAGTREEFVEIAVNLLVYSGLPAVVVLAIVTGSVSEQTRTAQALWRLGGASPRQIYTLFLAQAALANGAGALVGSLLALPTQAAFDTVLLREANSGLSTVRSPLAVSITVALVAILGVLGALGPARRAMRASPVVALRGDEPTRSRVRRFALPVAFTILVVLPLLGTLAAVPSLTANGDPNGPTLAVIAMLPAGQALVVATALYLPLVVAPVMAAWTAIPGVTGNVSWHLARHMAVTRAGTSSATVAPLMVGMGLFCSFSLVGTTAGHLAPSAGPGVNLFDGTLMLTPIGVIAALGSAAVVYMSSRRRTHDVAALRCAGATEGGTRLMFVFEALIYFGTAVLLLLVPLALQVALVSVPLAWTGHSLEALGLNPLPAVGVGLLGGGATVVIVVATGMAAWRRPLTQALRVV